MALTDIANSLEDVSSLSIKHGPFLASGAAGIAIFFYYYSMVNNGCAPLARDYLEGALTIPPTNVHTPVSLHGGICGIAWMMEHLKPLWFEDDSFDPNDEVDSLLIDYLRDHKDSLPYDLIGGLVGTGVYAIQRYRIKNIDQPIQLVLDTIKAQSSFEEAGISWFTPPEHLPNWQRALAPKGYYNLGVAHGIPGILTLLGALGRIPEYKVQALSLLNSAIDWLVDKINKNGDLFFPMWVGESVPPQRPKYGWCYGDLGVAAAFLALP